MPDDQGKLTPEERKRAAGWLEKFWKGDPKCSVCNGNSWTIGEHMVAPMSINEQGGVSIGGIIYPQVLVVCNNCGNTLYFNAALMRIAPSVAEKEDGDGEE